MRTFLFFAPLLALLACGGKEENSIRGNGGQAQNGGASSNTGGASANTGGVSMNNGGATAAGGSTSSTGGVSATGGTGASGGKPAGAAGQTTSGGGMTSGGAASTGGNSGQGTGGQTLVDCDLRKVLCKIAQPNCPDEQVPSVNGTCYGPCVPIATCACSAAAECPFNDRYTCWQRTHCGPYVN